MDCLQTLTASHVLIQVRSPMPPTYIFLIDVSYRAVGAGILPIIAEAIKSSLDHLPGGERTHVGFITFDSSLHFYKMSPGASAPQMMVSFTEPSSHSALALEGCSLPSSTVI